VFDFRAIGMLPLRFTPWLILLGVICGLLGDLFKRLLYAFQDLYDKCRIPLVARPVIPLMASILLGFFFINTTGGGHILIDALPAEDVAVSTVIALLVGRLLFTTLCYGSGTSGGIFLPLLACGALTGYGFGQVLIDCNVIAAPQVLNFLIVGMSAFFASVVKAPLTGMILILEMSGNFSHLGNLGIASLSAFVTAEVIGSQPVYEVLLHRMTQPPAAGRPQTAPRSVKV
jgi:H+/Cl- antiporter ClcA